MMNIVDNSIVSSDVGRNLFGGGRRQNGVFGPQDRSNALAMASVFFSSEGLSRVVIRALPTGQYFGARGNGISAVMYRMSANRFAFQMFKTDGSQINGNVIQGGGMAAAVDKFNADADLNSDFVAIALTADVDHVFSGGTGYAAATGLSGGAG